MKYNVIQSNQSEALLEKGIIKNELIKLSGSASNKYNAKSLCLLHFWDSITGNH
ncbi:MULTISPECIES: hypothetical protein [Sphingobacterium]|uniref:hypothetical protein n=1 Tax=Sphingobacterium TaxID=28453 RepID=UPI001405605C|nr:MULTISPECIES: hypothetical protein [Sphingobacterium]MCW2260334.1 hypothetical protein [Sphingobacterium kitahiroshimense]